ncbi:MAG: peptidylprolyl isomerase [Paracoccaceae bacterium]
MTQAKDGDTVRITYTGTLTDGTVFDSSEGRGPLEFTIGSGQIIPGLDKAMPGMAVGEKKRVEIGVMQAYGPIHADRVLDVPLEELPADIPREVGITLAMQGEDGQQMPVRVTAVTETHMRLDANHALAGKDLVFDIELVSIG